MTLIADDSGRVRVNVRLDSMCAGGVCVCVRAERSTVWCEWASLVDAGLNIPLRGFGG